MHWEAIGEPSYEKLRPTWEEVERALIQLKKVKSGSVFLISDTGSTFSVGGEYDVGLIVFISDDHEERYLLAPRNRWKGTTSLIVGFQPAEYSNRIIVQFSVAARAAKMFYKTGLPDSGAEWALDPNVVL